MRASSISVDTGAEPSLTQTVVARHRRAPIDDALKKFAADLSPAKGQAFFDQLVEYLVDCLGFEMVIVGELAAVGVARFTPIAEYPPSSDAMRALIGSHVNGLAAASGPSADVIEGGCINVPLLASDGRAIGVICGFGHAWSLEPATTRMLFRIIAHRAAAELEQQRARRELARRDALFIGLVSEGHDVVGVLDEAGAFTAVSPAIERVLGFCAETCSGLPVVELVHPLDRESVAALLRISGPQAYSVEARLRRGDGGWVTMAVTVAEHHDASGRALKILSARDLTDQRQLEDRLRQSQKTEMIGRLATGIAHDFGNILMVVRSYADVMGLRTTEDDPRHGYVDAIQEAVTRGADLSRQLLAFSRHREAEMKRLDLNASVGQSVELLRRVVGSTIRLETHLAADARFVIADPTQIEQLILNLTLNARDAMPNGGRIVFSTMPAGTGLLPPDVAAAPDDFVHFAVTDTGCGIPAENLARIFEPLFTTKTDGAGSGIGLATVHDIVKRHGGCIAVESEEGAGAAFHVFLRRTVAPTPRA